MCPKREKIIRELYDMLRSSGKLGEEITFEEYLKVFDYAREHGDLGVRSKD